MSVVLSGGVSLGAYFSGVVAQLGYFVANWNKQEEASGRKRFIHVDVVSGASAGALTGAMLTRFIARGMEDAEGFVQSCYNAWCSPELSLARLTCASSQTKSMFSNQAIEALAEKYVNSTEKNQLLFGQDHLIYTCTVTSLDPIHFTLSLGDATKPDEPNEHLDGHHDGLEIKAKTRRDWATFWFTNSNDGLRITEDTDAVMEPSKAWLRLRWIAMASGAFPIAWKPVRYARPGEVYSRKTTLRDNRVVRMRFMDGGVIDNMPFGRAAEAIVDYARKQHFCGEEQDHVMGGHLALERTYVLIDYSPPAGALPPASTNEDKETKLPPPVRDEDGSLWEQLGFAFEALNEQSFYMDLRGAARIDKRLEERQKHVWPILLRALELLKDGDAQVLGNLEQKGWEIFRSRYPVDADDSKVKEKFVAKVTAFENRFEVQKLLASVNEPIRTRFCRWAYLLDLIADLDEKHELKVLQVRPKNRLVSNFAGNFGGFFDQDYMRLDFLTGMEVMAAQLNQYVQARGWETVPVEMFATAETIGLSNPPRRPKEDPENIDDVKGSATAKTMLSVRGARFAKLNLPNKPWRALIVWCLNGTVYGWIALVAFVIALVLALRALLAQWLGPANALYALTGLFAGVAIMFLVIHLVRLAAKNKIGRQQNGELYKECGGKADTTPP
jgi:predicted acylesterase/phospholipase RssA